MSAEKKVLVCFGDRKRCVNIPAESENDLEYLNAIAIEVLKDVLPTSAIQIFLQLKDEEWGGEFVDIYDNQVIEDRSIVKMVVSEIAEEVNCLR